MPIEVEIHVVAIDTDRAVKSTRTECVTVPGKVMKLHEVLGGNQDEILRRLGDTVFTAALRELQAGKVDMGKMLVDSTGGRVGGRAAAPVVEHAPATGPGQPVPAPAGSAKDPLSEMLGLDLIRHQAGKDRQTRSAPGPAPAPPRQSGPGVAGFPR